MKILLSLAGFVAVIAMLIGACSSQTFIQATPRDNTIRIFTSGSGAGNIHSESIGNLFNGNCGEPFEIALQEGSVITLTAQPNSGSEFGGWSGVCKGRNRICTFIVGSHTHITAKFNLLEK